ncbi:hypothetical protein BDW72DRAFT_198067 [Aspergillus terricola var. indicus]
MESVQKSLEAGFIQEGRGRVSYQTIPINQITVDNANKALHMEQKQDLLLGAKIITVFDFEWGYYHLLMAKEDIEKAGFLTDMGLYK